MRLIRHILVCVVFLLSTSHALAASVHKCCSNVDCPMSQCQDAGCLTQVSPAGTTDKLIVPHEAAAQDFLEQPLTTLPSSDEEIWTPPD